MYPPFSDGTDVNAVARTADGTLMVTADELVRDSRGAAAAVAGAAGAVAGLAVLDAEAS